MIRKTIRSFISDKNDIWAIYAGLIFRNNRILAVYWPPVIANGPIWMLITFYRRSNRLGDFQILRS